MNETAKHLVFAIAFAVAGAIAVLWSWNTIAELFGGPAMQFKHALAVLLLLGTARVALGRMGRRLGSRGAHAHED